MLKALVILTLASLACGDKQQSTYVDPFAALDRHISHSLAFHYLWPWNQLMKAAAVLDDDGFDEPQIVSDPEKLVVNMHVKRFKPEELKVRVKTKNIIVEGKHHLDSDNRFMANHFVQRFVLPAGSKQEEVTAILKDGVLTISVPRHEVPAPPPEREVPIEVMPPTKPEEVEKPEKKHDKPKKPTEIVKTTEAPKETEAVTEKKEETLPTSSATPLEQLELVEATTHVGKIRKKELKDTAKTSKDNEVTKGVDVNNLDYSLIESE